MPEIRLVVVDDHAPTREQVVKDLSSGDIIKIVGEAKSSDEALKLSRELLPDVVLLDLHLPGFLDTMDLLKRLIVLRNVRVVIFGSLGKPSEVQDLLDAGAAGYVLKTDAPALIRMAILMVSRGSKGVVSPALPRHVTRLLPEERHILRQITQKGKFAKAALRLDISEDLLMLKVSALAAKLELETPEHLVKWAKKQGF